MDYSKSYRRRLVETRRRTIGGRIGGSRRGELGERSRVGGGWLRGSRRASRVTDMQFVTHLRNYTSAMI